MEECKGCCPAFCENPGLVDKIVCKRCCPRFCLGNPAYANKLGCEACCPSYCNAPSNAERLACTGCCPMYCRGSIGSAIEKTACAGCRLDSVPQAPRSSQINLRRVPLEDAPPQRAPLVEEEKEQDEE